MGDDRQAHGPCPACGLPHNWLCSNPFHVPNSAAGRPSDLEWEVRMLTYQRDALRSLLERLREGSVPFPNRAITTVLNRCDDWENRRLTPGRNISGDGGRVAPGGSC